MSLLSRLTGLFRRQLDSDLDAELRSHIEMRTDMNLAAGMSPEEARRDALLRFGNPAWMKEQTRRFDIVPWAESLTQDVRYAFRMFRKSPAFTLVAVLTLALGIGGNTAIFTLTHALLLKSLPVREPDRLVRITFAKPDLDFGLAGPMYDEIARRQQVFSGVLASSPMPLTLTDGAESRRLRGALLSGTACETLGVEPALGRLLTPDDDRPGGGRDGWAAVLGHGFWKSRFNSDPAVLGRPLTLEGARVTIVGVTPPGFHGVDVGQQPEIFLPLEFEVQMRGKSSVRHFGTSLWLTVMARLKPGATEGQARADIERMAPQILPAVDPKGLLQRGFFKGTRFGLTAGRTGRSFVRSQYRQPLIALQALVGVILLICCANLAGLMLARASARRHEFAIRAALGAARGRLVRQLLVEGAMIASIGAAAGLLFAQWASAALVAALMRHDKLLLDLNPDGQVLIFTAAITALAAVLSAIPSGLRATREQPAAGLKDSAQTVSPRSRLDSWLVSGQVGLASILLVAAALLAGTLYRLLSVHPGFSIGGVLLMPVDFSKRPETGALRVELYERIIGRLNTMPGVDSASAESIPLLTGWSSSTTYSAVLPHGETRTDTLHYNRLGPRYFATAGTRVLAGRDVSPQDRPGHDVCWLNRSAAAFFFPGGEAVGSYLRDPENPKDAGCEIVGVVEDMKYSNLRAPAPRTVYTPLAQNKAEDSVFLMMRTGNPAVAAESARRLLREMAPGSPILDPISIREQVRDSIGREQALAFIALFFAALGLLLAAIGVYGLLTYQVIQRTREIGVRIALGARRSQVQGLFIRRAALLTCAGLGGGLVAALGVGHLLRELLFEIKPADPLALLAAAASLSAAALLASYLPARRATRVDPMVALRYE